MEEVIIEGKVTEIENAFGSVSSHKIGDKIWLYVVKDMIAFLNENVGKDVKLTLGAKN